MSNEKVSFGVSTSSDEKLKTIYIGEGLTGKMFAYHYKVTNQHPATALTSVPIQGFSTLAAEHGRMTKEHALAMFGTDNAVEITQRMNEAYNDPANKAVLIQQLATDAFSQPISKKRPNGQNFN